MENNIKRIIKQSKFINKQHEGAIGIFVLYHQLINVHQEIFKNFDLTMQQYNVLRILRGQHPKKISIVEIKSRLVDRMSDVSRLLDRLEKGNFIIRTNSTDDKRAKDVIIAPNGLDILTKIDPLIHHTDNFSNLTEEELDQLIALINKSLVV
jgi:MarR family transcriptional regulator, multiple gene regulator MgrA